MLTCKILQRIGPTRYAMPCRMDETIAFLHATSDASRPDVEDLNVVGSKWLLGRISLQFN
jgi:hypothetical protein